MSKVHDSIDEMFDELNKEYNKHPVRNWMYKQLTFHIDTAGHSMYYNLLRPIELVQGIFSELKWAYQRLTRGWDDRVCWSIDYWLDYMMPDILNQFKEIKNSIPMFCLDEFNHDENYNYTPENEEKAIKNWNNIIDDMIVGFKASKYLRDDLEFVDREQYKTASDDLEELRKKGMYLFVNHYGDLWD